MSESLSRLIVNTGLPPPKTTARVKPSASKTAPVVVVGGDMPGLIGHNALNRVLLLLIATGALGNEEQEPPVA
jgi:hypothetical protein